MLLIYTHTITVRIVYTFNLVFKTVLDVEYELTSDLESYQNYNGNKFAYTTTDKSFGTHILSSNLLFETTVNLALPEPSKLHNGFPIFFEASFSSFIPYDVFATVFYFATRYEEYLQPQLDKHQRFQAEQSLFYKHNLLQKPFLNNLITDFEKTIFEKFNLKSKHKNNFNAVSTIDIDNAYAYAHKGFKRNIGGALKDVFHLNFKQLAARVKSNINDSDDPYNTFELIHDLHKQYKIPLNYFVLIGDYSNYDKNPNFENPNFRKLLNDLSENHNMGLHPSYVCYNNLDKIEIEKKRLENIIEKKVTAARCHFLRVKLPETYRAFINYGITDDYTMIYASQSGFRTGLCTPHQWFDLERNESTTLTIHTSAVMEGTLRDYNKLDAFEASHLIENTITKIKQVNGEFVSVWHNDSFTKENYKWVTVYEEMLKTLNNQ